MVGHLRILDHFNWFGHLRQLSRWNWFGHTQQLSYLNQFGHLRQLSHLNRFGQSRQLENFNQFGHFSNFSQSAHLGQLDHLKQFGHLRESVPVNLFGHLRHCDCLRQLSNDCTVSSFETVQSVHTIYDLSLVKIINSPEQFKFDKYLSILPKNPLKNKCKKLLYPAKGHNHHHTIVN